MTRYRQRGECEAWQVGDVAGKPEWILSASEQPDATWFIEFRGNGWHLTASAYVAQWLVRDEHGFVSVWDADQFAAKFEPTLKDGTE